MPIHAVQHVRRLRGGAQSHLMRADDGHYYVVKFQNNPQHVRVLANELLATRLAERIGLPVPHADVIEVDAWLIAQTPELHVQMGNRTAGCQPGLQFASRYAVDPLTGQVFDYLPEAMLERVRNLDAFAGMLAFDKWACNSNGRQAVFWKKARERKFTATFIDQGYCFNAGEWSFPDAPLRGVYPYNAVYGDVHGWSSFEPWLGRIEDIDPDVIFECADGVPPEWCGDWEGLQRICDALVSRRSRVRELIEAFKDSTRRPFPAWRPQADITVEAGARVQ
jgi:HipA-like protein